MTLPQASGGKGTLSYSLSSGLPSGISFNSQTRVLSGSSAQAVDPKNFTYTVQDSMGRTASLTFTLVIKKDIAPSFGDKTIANQNLKINEAVNITLPESTWGNRGPTYTLTPSLPTGLSFNSNRNSRKITGAPTQAMPQTTYTYTSTDGDGDSVSLTFSVTVINPLGFSVANISDKYFEKNTAASVILPAAATNKAGGSITYTITPALPAGLSFSLSNRTLSGTPTQTKSKTGLYIYCYRST